jgi:type II secretory ATPase GspE/PulE/Tfp pilus assembly ATPase PilB-like protein
LEDHPYLNLHHKTLETIPPTINEQSHEIYIGSKPLKHTFDTKFSMMQLNHEQKRKFHSIIENQQGLHVLACTHGSGNFFFVKYITQHFQTLGKNILLSTTMAHQHFVYAPQ